ncbi:MAG TPA: chemotaxis protein CheD, partial [Longimicrobiaceae bacterium]|nr:chemotaxis protein CheD [Longimicrobiaceae bacterium]
RVAGMSHSLLPEPRRGVVPENPAKFVATAIPALLAEMEARGADRARITARLVGGATMFGNLLAKRTMHTGERNVAVARSVLAAEGVPLVGEEVGKEHGRSVYFHAADGRVEVRSYRDGEVIL